MTNKIVNLKVDGEKIKGTLVFPQKLKSKNPCVLFIHGWTSSEKGYIPRAQAVAEKGAICLTFDMRGHGKSEGKLGNLSRKDHLKDVITAYDFLISQPKIDKNKIGVVGASYGGYLASILSLKRKVKWLVLRAPALYSDNSFSLSSRKVMNEDPKKRARKYKKNKVNLNNLALRSLSKFKGRLLLIRSEKDETIPKKYIDAYSKAINSQAQLDYKVIKNATHSLEKEEWKQEFINMLKDWFTI